MMMMMMFLMSFPNIRSLIFSSLIFAKNTCFLSRSRDFFRTRDVCFFLINLSGARYRLLICSVWTDLNTKIKIFKIRRQNPEPEPTVYTRPDTPGVKIQSFLPQLKTQTFILNSTTVVNINVLAE